ncbi:glycoside hydrolase family protein [Candidatus Ichthyocystis sparus]|uniref:glycoside hydrolase family protein n=1 Tax=Candidatus Ichthyocystis sparus TaxID=1561004 RepID=UPI00159EDE07|nr:glycoside hydrolase family protein [Candidatus Ichthyocystis sparus]
MGRETGVNSGSSAGTGKVGLAWPNGNDPALANFKTNNVSPVYTYTPFLPSQAKSLGFDPIPMLWGTTQFADFQRLVVKGYATTVLGFNEPNEAGQADMSPQTAAMYWKQYIDPLKDQGYSLISPACSSAPSGKTWMMDFFAACSGCHFDGLAVHWYGTSSQSFINYLIDFHDTFNLPIWPTEFACQNFSGGGQCTEGQSSDFMTTVKDFMDGTSWVPHYFAFGLFHISDDETAPVWHLMDADGQPSELGLLYIN